MLGGRGGCIGGGDGRSLFLSVMGGPSGVGCFGGVSGAIGDCVVSEETTWTWGRLGV